MQTSSTIGLARTDSTPKGVDFQSIPRFSTLNSPNNQLGCHRSNEQHNSEDAARLYTADDNNARSTKELGVGDGVINLGRHFVQPSMY